MNMNGCRMVLEKSGRVLTEVVLCETEKEPHDMETPQISSLAGKYNTAVTAILSRMVVTAEFYDAIFT